MPPKSKNTKASGSKTLSQMGPPPVKKAKTATTRTKPPVWDFSASPVVAVPLAPKKTRTTDVKGKAKATPLPEGDRLWTDKYEPTTEAELAVHVRKVQNVREWLVEAFEGGSTGKLRKYRRILALIGPAGVGKSTTVRVLAREMGFEIMEWRSTMDENFARDDLYGADFRPMEQEALSDKFEAFLTRASTCQNLFSQPAAGISLPQQSKQVVLLEDLPNILHPRTQNSFHDALRSLVNSSSLEAPGAPVIIVVSDAGTRGEASDERMSQGGGWGKDVVDVRSVIPKDLLNGPYVVQIPFRPIAPTFLKKALQLLTDKHFSTTSALPKDMLDIIVGSANGDIRSAIMALEFACSKGFPNGKTGKTKGRAKVGDARSLMESITRREQSLALFHMIGRVLYNKRRGQPPSPSAPKKDIQTLQDIDAQIKDAWPLPPHLHEHERIPSRVNIDTLYSDSPIDSSLFSLYLHQNYTQFCNTIEEVDGVSEGLSWVDSSGGEAWHQANPHQFHLITMGTLHALPSPASSAKKLMCKPEFFEVLKKEREGMDGVGDVRQWLSDTVVNSSEFKDGSTRRAGGWSDREVATELGGVLKALSLATSSSSQQRALNQEPPPASHRLFSSMVFVKGVNSGTPLGEEDDAEDVVNDDEGNVLVVDESEQARLELRERLRLEESSKERLGGWLAQDDIEEF